MSTSSISARSTFVASSLTIGLGPLIRSAEIFPACQRSRTSESPALCPRELSKTSSTTFASGSQAKRTSSLAPGALGSCPIVNR